MKRLRWELLHALRFMGLPGWVALALLPPGLLVAWAGMAPMQANTERLDADSALLEKRLVERGAKTADVALSPQQQLAEFGRRFSDEKSITDALTRLHDAARRQGVQIERAEFRFANDARDPLARYAIVLPVKSDYRALRRFTQDVLHELPSLALEEVSLRRSDAKSPLLEAQLRFVLFVNKPG